jgi:hypothetical protein
VYWLQQLGAILFFIPLTRVILMATFGLTMNAFTTQVQAAPTRIMAPLIITVSGSYVLANDITATSGGAAIEIQASEVTLNLNGHTINASQGDGIIIDSNDLNNNNAPVVKCSRE